MNGDGTLQLTNGLMKDVVSAAVIAELQTRGALRLAGDYKDR